jgi:tetratricopeptide (TPR) repeat protein
MKLSWEFSRLILLVTTFNAAALANSGAIKPIESTMAYDLLTQEQKVRQIPKDAEKLFRAVITDATTRAVQTNQQPQTKAEALAVLEAIQLALVKHNFLQPREEKDWPQTLGIALTPLTLTVEARKRVLSSLSNISRAKHVDLAKPFYYVDCDMGAQLFLAVGERLGWDIRLVEIPDHNFVRWHLSDSIKVNWDWTLGHSLEDKHYLSSIPQSEDVRLRTQYLRSFDPKEAKAYYLGLIGSKAENAEDGERLFLEAVELYPHPLTLNNFAWFYVTKPEFAKNKQKIEVAVAYGLAAWSIEPNNGNIADTVACALAAKGNKYMAIEIEKFAIDHARPWQRQAFRDNLDRITAGEPCK